MPHPVDLGAGAERVVGLVVLGRVIVLMLVEEHGSLCQLPTTQTAPVMSGQQLVPLDTITTQAHDSRLRALSTSPFSRLTNANMVRYFGFAKKTKMLRRITKASSRVI